MSSFSSFGDYGLTTVKSNPMTTFIIIILVLLLIIAIVLLIMDTTKGIFRPNLPGEGCSMNDDNCGDGLVCDLDIANLENTICQIPETLVDSIPEPEPNEDPNPPAEGSPETVPEPIGDSCSLSPSDRPCTEYNNGFIKGQRYICPTNFTLIDGFPPGELEGPHCQMNDGSRNTPATCESFNDPGCDYTKSTLPCYGKWSTEEYGGHLYYGRYHVVPAMPAEKLCK